MSYVVKSEAVKHFQNQFSQYPTGPLQNISGNLEFNTAAFPVDNSLHDELVNFLLRLTSHKVAVVIGVVSEEFL